MTEGSGLTGRSAGDAGRVGRTHRGRIPRWSGLPYLAAGIGVVLVVACIYLVSRDRALPSAFGQLPGSDLQSLAGVGSLASPAPDQPTAVTPVVAGKAPVPAPLPSRAGTLKPTATASLAKATALVTTPSAPSTPSSSPAPLPAAGVAQRIQLPSQSVDAAVVSVTTTQGALQVPQNPAQVGWWVGSALPGSQTGTTVLDGHIDSAVAGIGAFWKLANLDAGAPVTLQLLGGRTVRYLVVARRVYPKNAGLPASLFSLTGPPALLLISCGGPFDTALKSYEDNIAVFATLQN